MHPVVATLSLIMLNDFPALASAQQGFVLSRSFNPCTSIPSCPTPFIFQFIMFITHKELVYFCASFIFLQKTKQKNNNKQVVQPPTEFMSVSMAGKTRPPGLPHAMDAELEGLWPCMISISGQWFIISATNPFQRAFCLCEL